MSSMMSHIARKILILYLVLTVVTFSARSQAQPTQGEIESVEVVIQKERQITLPQAARNFDKVPPRPVEPIKPAITYTFRNIGFNSALYNPVIRPLRLQDEKLEPLAGNYISAGFGNYVSPFLEGALNSKRNRDRFYGLRLFHQSFGTGPVDDKNSGNGRSEVGAYGKLIGEKATIGGEVDFERINTHFYGYVPTPVEIKAEDIRQTYSIFSLRGELQNSKPADFNYALKAGFSYLDDRYSASESEVSLAWKSDYAMSNSSRLLISADYFLISRQDESVEAKGRHLFKVRPMYEFTPLEKLILTVGANVVYENDTLGKAKSFHVYPVAIARYTLSPSLEAYASLEGDIDKVSLHTLARENNWVGSNIGIFHTNRSLEFAAGLRGRAGSKVALATGVAFANLKNWYFYQNNPTDVARFAPNYDQGNVTRLNLFAEAGVAQAEKLKVSVRGDLYSYSTDQVTEAWHRPTYKASLFSSLNLYKKISLQADFHVMGGMKAFDPINIQTVTLDPAFDLNARVNYFFSRKFSAFVRFNNIFNSDYPMYFRYPVRGFQAMGGVTWSF
jgi:hypothetical protein